MVHKIGIDIGNFKTVIYSSKANGTVVEDNMGKREIATVVELMTPQRFYGKGCSSDNNDNINMRNRQFLKNLSDENNRACLFMWLEYMHKICEVDNYRCSVLTVPEYFSSQEKSILKQICDASNLNVVGFVSHMTGIGAYAGLLSQSTPENFMIMDFGNHKTVIGLFEKKDNKVMPKARYWITRGAVDYDEAIYRGIIEKYGFNDNKVMRERILKETDKIKKAMNTLDNVEVVIMDEAYKNVTCVFSKAEYTERTKNATDEITYFVNNVLKETQFKEGHIEVVGKNYQNIFIKDILAELDVKQLLHASESAAHGACMYLAVNSSTEIKYSVEEIINCTTTALVGDQDVTVFNKDDFVGAQRKIKFEAKNCNVENDTLVVGIRENDMPVGKILLDQKACKEDDLITIEVKYNSFLLLEVVGVTNNDKQMAYKFESFRLSEEEILKCVNAERVFVEQENKYKMAGEIRNKTEKMFDGLVSQLQTHFNEMFSEEEYDKINGIVDEYFDLAATRDFDTEKKNADEFTAKLKFVTDKLQAKEKEIRETVGGFIGETDNLFKEQIEFMRTTSGTKLNQMKTSALNYLSAMSLDLYDLENYSKQGYESVKGTFEKLSKSVKEEHKAMVEAEKKKKQVEAEKAKKKEAKPAEKKKEVKKEEVKKKTETTTDKNEEENA